MSLFKNNYFLLTLAALAALFLGYLWGANASKEGGTIIKQARHQRNFQYSYISPLLECSLTTPDSTKIKSLEKQIIAIVNKAVSENKIKTASVYLHDLNSNAFVGINRADKFSPASLLKVPIMIAYFKMAEGDPTLLDKKLKVVDIYANPGITQNIMPLKSTKINEEYSIEELIKYSIHYSDNKAAGTLLMNIPEETINSVYADLGISPPGQDGLENFMNIMDYASFFEILYNASYLSKPMSDKALGLLTDSSFSYGLSAGVPMDIKIAHKFGERIIEKEKQLHDCGIIYEPNNPYLLCIMTRSYVENDNNFNKMANFIKDISQQVHRSLTNK